MIDKRQLLPLLEEKMKLLACKLAAIPGVADKGFTIRPDAWMNENGFFLAYISCARLLYRNEEPIELTIDVSITGDLLLLETGIYLSNGSLIRDFGSVSFSGETLDEVKPALERYFDHLSANELVILGNFLLEQKDEPN